MWLVESIQSMQYTVACEHDMITQYLQQILGYRVEFKVRLISKPFIRAVLSNFWKYGWATWKFWSRTKILKTPREQQKQV